ncbi:MAG: S1 RNA-binding domain-containing protein, partial [Pseudomonadota bacterium]
DSDKERVSLGIKQLTEDPFGGERQEGELKKGAIVTCEVIEVKENGVDVKIIGTDFTTFIRRSELARDRSDQRPERFEKGEKMDARVTLFDKSARKVQVSIKALEMAEEKEAIAQYGSADSGASLGDILGAAMKQRTSDGEEAKPKKAAKKEAAESDDAAEKPKKTKKAKAEGEEGEEAPKAAKTKKKDASAA